MIESGPTIDALIAFARALEGEGVDPRAIEVRLPENDWRRLVAAVERDAKAMRLAHDPTVELAVGRGGPLTVLGVRYLIRYD